MQRKPPRRRPHSSHRVKPSPPNKKRQSRHFVRQIEFVAVILLQKKRITHPLERVARLGGVRTRHSRDTWLLL
jgi:hypothetical protein